MQWESCDFWIFQISKKLEIDIFPAKFQWINTHKISSHFPMRKMTKISKQNPMENMGFLYFSNFQISQK